MKLARFFRFLIAGLFSLGVSCAASAQTAEPIHLNVSLDETEIYIGGADDKKSDGRGPVQSYYRGLRVRKDRMVGYFTASQKKEALAFARQHSSNGETLNIIGHSYGSVAAANVAQALADSGTIVTNLVGIDSVNKPFKTGAAESENILKTISVIATRTGSTGDRVEALGKLIGGGGAEAFEEGNAAVFVSVDAHHQEFRKAFENSGARRLIDESYESTKTWERHDGS